MKSLTIAVLLLAPFVAHASTISDVVVFGDSLSDNGNVYAVSSALGMPTPPSPPYFDGRFSNGPVAVEDFASYLGLPLKDYAYGGATTGVGDSGDGGSVTSLGQGLPGMTTQFDGYASAVVNSAPGTPAPTSSLFVVWGGPDDLLAPSAADAGNPIAIANTAAANIIGIVDGLEALGAPEVLVPGVTDLALVPAYASEQAAANLFAITFNADLISGLPQGATYVDTYSLLQKVVNDPSAYGFTDVINPYLSGMANCATPNDCLFFDTQHPTAAGQQLLAQDLEAVPEPRTAVLTLSILGVLGFVRWRSRRRAAQPIGL